MKRGLKEKGGQISFEYLMVMGFVTFILSLILGVAFFYVNSVQDQTRLGHVTQFAKKVISTSEQVFYAGEPSKATIEAYLPDKVTNITIAENTLFISLETSSGPNTLGFGSNINISGTITSSQGIKRLEINSLSGVAVIGAA